MLFRLSISLVFLLMCVLPSFAKDYDFLLPSNETLRLVKNRFSALKAKASSSDIPEFEKFVNNGAFDKVIKEFGNLASLKEKWWLEAYKKKQLRKQEVLFYLFSSTVPDKSVRNVLSQAKILPKGLEFYPVLRGIPPVEYLKKMKSWKEMVGIRVKINPLIFRGVGAKVVPAFVLATCDIVSGVLRSKTCVYRKVIYGDVSLKFALEKLLGK